MHTKVSSLKSKLDFSEKWRNALEEALAKALNKTRGQVKEATKPGSFLDLNNLTGKRAIRKSGRLHVPIQNYPVKLELFEYEQPESPAKNYEKRSKSLPSTIGSFKERASYEKAINLKKLDPE